MDIIGIQKQAIVLDERERKQLINVLRYVYHRINEHKKAVGIRAEFLDYMLQNLENLNESDF